MASHLSSQSRFSEGKECSVPRVNCAFHPNELITNFCTCECCLLPLCPSCIKVHTNEHINMKMVNPQYEPITDLLHEIFYEVDENLEQYNNNYKKIVEINARVDTFRTTIQQKINSVKTNVITEVEKYFCKLDEEIQTQIDNMNYIQHLGNYKEETKKIIMGLKNIEKGFNPDNQKIMRIAIKYKGDHISKELADFQVGLDEFFHEVNNNFVTFSVREDYRQLVNSCLESLRKVQISDALSLTPINQISKNIREVCEKNSNESKKEIIKSIGSFLSLSNQKNKYNQENSFHDYESYNSMSSKMQKPSIGTIRELTPNRSEQKRSLSKGKGLSLMQIQNNCFTSNVRTWKAPRAVNISQPIEFHRTALVRRNDAI